jgi:hypothetical protein
MRRWSEKDKALERRAKELNPDTPYARRGQPSQHGEVLLVVTDQTTMLRAGNIECCCKAPLRPESLQPRRQKNEKRAIKKIKSL